MIDSQDHGTMLVDYVRRDECCLKHRHNILLTPGMTEVTRQIQLANRIKFDSCPFRSIEHERVHKYHSKQFSC